ALPIWDLYGYGSTRVNHWNYRARWIVSRGASALERLRGPRRRPARSLGGPGAPAEPVERRAGPYRPACRVARKLRQRLSTGCQDCAGRVLSPRGAELRKLLFRRRVFDAQHKHQRHPLPALRDQGSGSQVAVLLCGLQRDVRQGGGASADREYALSPALELWHQQGLRFRADAQLSRSIRAARQQRHFVQPRIAAARL